MGYEKAEKLRRLERLIDIYEQRLTNLSYTYVKDWEQAKDIVQEVFIKVYDKLDTMGEIEYEKTWLFTICANRSKDYLRSIKSKRKMITKVIHTIFTKESNDSPDVLIETSERENDLVKKVLLLPLIYREVIILFYYEELSINEISELLSINSSTIRTRLDRGRKMLKETLKGDVHYER
ncbi:sigma-70 family RNA polymerase sigma factor [Bacillus timonensis]|nr:sigma-70 family RNA polymerase sigma factor [Bacillus timonensis]